MLQAFDFVKLAELTAAEGYGYTRLFDDAAVPHDVLCSAANTLPDDFHCCGITYGDIRSRRVAAITGSAGAVLHDAYVPDQSLLLVTNGHRALVEAYGDERWRHYQASTWPQPHSHTYETEVISRGPFEGRKMSLKLYDRLLPRRLDGPVFYLSVRSDDRNICHWIFEALPRLRMLELTPELAGIPLLLTQPPTAYQAFTLALLGVSNPVVVTDGQPVEAKQLVFASIPAPAYLHPPALSWLRERLTRPISDQPAAFARKLYISRADSAMRRVSNERDVLKLIEPLGYQRLVMSELSPREQALAFMHADEIILPHGQAGANLIFAKPSCRVIELIHPSLRSMTYHNVACLLGMTYRHLLGTRSFNRKDYSVSVAALGALIAPMSQLRSV